MTTRPVRIAHVAARLVVGGMETVVASLARGVARDRFDATIWCLEEADRLGKELQAEGQSLLELGKRSRRDVGLFSRIARLARRHRIDILHCHDELSWFYGTIGGRLGGVSRVVLTLHGRRADISKRHLFEQRLLGRFTSAIVAVSSCLARQVTRELRLAAPSVRVIQNGIALERREAWAARESARRALGVPPGAFAVGSVGALVPVKKIELIVEAAARAREAIPALHVALIGDGPCRERLAHKVAQLGMGHAVTLAGERRDIGALLPAFDLYVSSSDYEGTSLSILEAMAAERTVIATAVGGNPEIIQHGETGVLVERGNELALAVAMVDLFRNPERRRLLGRQARSVVERTYGAARMIDDYERLYASLAADRSNGRVSRS